MLNKLIVRNARRSTKDYFIYMITMGGVAAFMYAFNSLLFSDMVQGMWETAMIMAVMIGLVTVFIVLLVAWLINYMVRFMLEKRSREFGTYLLLGMEKKQVSKLYMRENLLLGGISLVAGLVAGIFLQQIVMIVFYRLFSADYKIQMGSSPWCFLMTMGCYLICYLFALRKNRKNFKKMSISTLMKMDQMGEAVETGREKWKQLLFFVAIFYFIGFFYLVFHGNYNPLGVILAVVGFILAIYLFYQGLAAFLVCYIHRGGRLVYRRDSLFLFRQLASKMRTMRFTMGTLTILFTGAILGGCVAMMFASYQKEAIHNAVPWDLMIYSADPQETFQREQQLIDEKTTVQERILYRIYQNQNSNEMNYYLYTHVSNFAGYFTNEDGSLNVEKVKTDEYKPYYEYDTYLSLSDYNKLRQMMGYEPAVLEEDQYLIHLKSRLLRDIEPERMEQQLEISGKKYQFAASYTEAFSQNGMNGADYIFVVPDSACDNLTYYYSMLVMDLEGMAPADLLDNLTECYYETHERPVNELEPTDDEAEFDEDLYSIIPACGSDEVFTISSEDVAIKDIQTPMYLAITSSITFPLVYIALIFVCVAFTILAVQQLSDSTRFRYRYDVLRKLGVNQKELSFLILKQLLMYYMIPIVIALVFSGFIGIFAGERFVFYTGASANFLSYYGISVLVFVGIYLLYFAATYLSFSRNVEQVFVRME